MRRRKPKPTALKVIEGNPRKRPLNQREPKPVLSIPTCPAHLSPKGAAHLRGRGNAEAVEAIKADARARAVRLGALIEALRAEGITSANAIAKALNDRDVATPRGGRWTAWSVLNLIERKARGA